MAYQYGVGVRKDLLAMVPADGKVIGSIGCGNGITEYEFVKQGREVHGVDVLAEAIEQAKTRLTSARVIDPSETRFFEPDTLDGLILADVIEHVPLAWNALKDYVAAVKPGGWVAISVPNMRGLRVLGDFIIKGDWPEHEMGIFDKTHIQMMSRKRLDRWCAGAGLAPEKRFARYSCSGKWPVRVLDAVSLGLLHDWLQMQIQAVYRKRR
jgi:2-polyprenyl-3-methyl-5-hydroxy-6-metoxy-1,4-benzoquinol methylase